MHRSLNSRLAWIVVAGTQAVVGCGDQPADIEADEDDTSRSEAVWANSADTWTSNIAICNSGQCTIPVCFGKVDPNNGSQWSGDLSGSTAAERQTVKDAITNTYSSLARISFSGWGACGPANDYSADPTGIRIQLSGVSSGTTNPFPKRNLFIQNTSYSGAFVSCFNNSGPYTYPVDGSVYASVHAFCLTKDAVHETFHVLGAGHEHDRTDVSIPSGVCNGAAGEQGITWSGYGPFDAYSVSAGSYCSSSTTRLSSTDVAWLQHTYGRTSNDWLWWVDGNPQDIWAAGNHPVPGLQSNYSQTNVSGSYSSVTGDYDGDGRDDIFWAPSGHIWWGKNRSTFDYAPYEYPIDSSFVLLKGDFDADGRGDIFLYNPTSGNNDYVLWGSGNRNAPFASALRPVGGGPYQPFTGDFDGNGATDIFWYGSTSYIWWGKTNGTRTFDMPATPVTVTAGIPQHVSGDFNGDGFDDILWYNPNGTDFIWWSLGSSRTFSGGVLNSPGTGTVFAGDFTGDGRSDLFFNSPGPNDVIWAGNWDKTWTPIPVSSDNSSVAIVGNFDGLEVVQIAPPIVRSHDDILWYTPGDVL